MSFEQYLNEIKKIKLLDASEEAELWHKFKVNACLEARSKLIEHYQPLVFKLAMRWKLPETTMLDIIQEGTVGLIEAAENYDYTKGVAFSLYAMHRINGRIINFLEREGKEVYACIDSPVNGDDTGVTFAEFLVDTAATVPEQIEHNYIVGEVKSAINRLPAKEQLVVSGMYIDEQEPKQLAELLNVSISHIYRLQKQGIRRVRGMLSKMMCELKK